MNSFHSLRHSRIIARYFVPHFSSRSSKAASAASSHTSKATRKWLAAHPRFQPHYTPKHASWLDLAELFFLILTRRLLRRGEFSSRQDLADKIENVTIAYNRTAKPYRWTYDGRPLKVT